jgi:hypothetical protein
MLTIDSRFTLEDERHTDVLEVATPTGALKERTESTGNATR